MSSHKGFSPARGNILVLKDVQAETEKVLPSGIVMPTSNDPISSGTVMALGPDAAGYMKNGQKVVFSPWTGFAMSLKGDAGYLLMSEHEILGVFKGEVGDVMVR